jgi:hypothetical protein
MWRLVLLLSEWIISASITLITEEIRHYETSVVTRATRRHIPEDGILHSHLRKNLKSYKVFDNFRPLVCRKVCLTPAPFNKESVTIVG